MPTADREECGQAGREWVLGNESNMSARQMGVRFIECIDTCLRNWTKRKKFSLYKINQLQKIENPGII